MGEAALRTRVAAPATMVAQLEHLARFAESLTCQQLASFLGTEAEAGRGRSRVRPWSRG